MRDSKRDTDIKNRLLDSVGEGEGGMICENSIETCILSCVKFASPGSIHETGCSGLVHWANPEGWDEEGCGRGAWDRRDTCTLVADSCQCMAKTTTIL